ncbi:ABC transporter ATP-binding protein [Pseudooceanicola lipolyticus]|uniref:ABC transporter ATP-binding protein n=1 Tax=Pseudooceanicola lipolyticus TaxID=2029104 RepID=A0A2M8J7A6_9RHOB|nr:ATP-binding cassette domain-containing protein [Pseudooceanicola lipolyticus]PJE38659.1 ABC transporter ATP-binding protein [Pseudooceanicola lipolyticus]
MSDYILDVRGLSGGYDTTQIFSDISLQIAEGESIGIFGPNGHGKTTFLKTLSGLIDPWAGDIFFSGQRMNREGERGSRRWRNFNYDAVTRRRIDPKAVARAGLIHVQQGNLLFPELTVDETLSIATTAAHGRKGWSLPEVHALFPRLHERGSHKIRFLSGGERQMVSMAAGLMAAPKLLILDEPTLGLSPKVRQELCDAILSVRKLGLPIVLIDQDVAFLEQIIDTLYLFDHGRFSGRMEKEEMPDHQTLMEMLFGEAH